MYFMGLDKTAIKASEALYIKLGDGGKWERQCIRDGIIRFGYDDTPFEAAILGDRETVFKHWLAKRHDQGAATRDTNQILSYFGAGDDTLWITFHDRSLWWCFAKPGVKPWKDGEGSYREAKGEWKNTDMKGIELTFDKLSGSLLKTHGFRGTVCKIKEFTYLMRKLNGESLPEVDAAIEAQNRMVDTIVPLMQKLTPQDFELLVDLVFSNSGWRRVSPVGKNQKIIDIDLMLPTTNERAYIQIKSEAKKTDLAEHVAHLEQTRIYSRLFFIFHTGEIEEPTKYGKNVTLLDGTKLARMVLNAGLTSWLIDKTS
jgi:Restriction endonuclease